MPDDKIVSHTGTADGFHNICQIILKGGGGIFDPKVFSQCIFYVFFGVFFVFF